MTEHDYNHAVFDPGKEGNVALRFANDSPKATSRAPSFPLEDLDTGETVELKDYWAKENLIIEFGSFT